MSQLLDGLHILVLEDEFLIAMDVEQLCRDYGAREVTILRSLAGADGAGIGEAGAGVDGAEMDGRGLPIRFDAAIVDLMLDGVSTLDFAKTLFERKVPFIFASGYCDVAEIEAGFPGVAMITKPYSGIDLIQALAASCGRPVERPMGQPTDQVVGDPIT
ncbi:MAG TPA: response regulator [Mesorhizobium sp.]